jgi:xanthine dehydrogenase large subunit
MVGIERVMDHVAFVMRREPLEVRKANFYRAMQAADASGGDISASMKAQGSAMGGEVDLTSRGAELPVGSHALPPDGRVQTTPYHMPVEDFIGHELVAELERSSDYRARKAEIARWNAESAVLKRGIALTPVKFGISFTLTWLNQAGALVHVYQDGSIALNHGGTEMGQGLFQKVAQVTAHVFGVDTSMVKITATDTGKVPNTSATAASSGSDLNGMAAKAAAETIRGRLAEFIAEKHQVAPSSVRGRNG